MADDKQKRLEERGEPEGKTGQQGNQAAGEKRKLPSNCLPRDHESAEKPNISMNLVRPNETKGTGVSIKLGSDPKKQKTEPVLLTKKGTVASAFNDESDDDEEEMPAEAKMRMRNIGRGTPTSAGPNSFNKGSKGFSDHRKAMEKSFKIQHPTRSKEVKE